MGKTGPIKTAETMKMTTAGSILNNAFIIFYYTFFFLINRVDMFFSVSKPALTSYSVHASSAIHVVMVEILL